MPRKVVIVGGVAGGASCAARLRRLDDKCEIVLFEKGGYISFANCGLPYHIGGVIKERDQLLLQTPESFNARFGVDVRINSEVTSIDRAAKTVTVKNHTDGSEYKESYETLVLSPGSTPVRPPIEGIDSEGVMTLWTIPDMDKIIERIKNNNVKSAIVIGGGFIGIEMAENLHELGIGVTLVEMMSQVMAPLDFEMAQLVHRELHDNGIGLALGDGVKKFENIPGGVRVTLASGKQLEAGIVILSIGVKPNGQLAKDCGLTVNKRGAIVVDDHLRTDDENIYAVGDAVETTNFMTGERTTIPLAGPANKMGRMAADNICGMERTYVGSQGSAILKVFNLTAASTGLNEKDMLQAGMEINKDYKVTILHPMSHAGYYPGGKGMALKVMFSPHGRILGAQAVGFEGVDKRIDVLATAMRMGATVYDLQELDLCYAPPYSSAKDPVNMAGFSAANILAGIVDNITWSEIDVDEKKNFVLLDVRTNMEFNMGAVEGSVNIPVDELRDRLGELDKDKKYYVYCAVGVRAYIACRIMMQNGFSDVKNVAGGYTTWAVYSKDYTANMKEPQSEMKSESPLDNITAEYSVDACGLQCPGPVMKLYKTMESAKDGDMIKISATDPGFFADAASWCERTGNTYIRGENLGGNYVVYIKKGSVKQTAAVNAGEIPHDKSIIVFSGDLDKAIAAFIIANGAAAMGRKITMFFTFWGLNILRKKSRVKADKNLIERMFGFMMPRGASRLKLSNMNMGGMGASMIKGIMKKKNVSTLEELIQSALDNGVRMIACTMSMDLMGIRKEELIDGIGYAGVATYLGAAENSDTNLFI